MEIEIIDYQPDRDQELLDLFYQSVFYDKKEFDYIRIPNRWLFRYTISPRYIVKLALYENRVIASLGILIRDGVFNDKRIKIGCFVDNCILPTFHGEFEMIFSRLFTEIEKEARNMGVVLIQGWDFLVNFERHRTFYKNNGFIELQGVNWFSSAINLKGDYPFKWEAKTNYFWKLFFKLMMQYYIGRSKFIPKSPEGVVIRQSNNSDTEVMYQFLTMNRDEYFSAHEDLKEFKKLIDSKLLNGILAMKGEKIIGAMTYFTVGWGGWMFKKPFFDKNPHAFISLTPDEFVVRPEYQATTLPLNMILFLMNTNSSAKKGFNFVATVFDRRCEWKRKAYKKLGFSEPKFDYGVTMVKPLNNDIKIKKNKIWSLPARYILAPVPPNPNSINTI